jgi:hypothetical protein
MWSVKYLQTFQMIVLLRSSGYKSKLSFEKSGLDIKRGSTTFACSIYSSTVKIEAARSQKILKVQGDSELLLGFLWPIILKLKKKQ